MLAYDFEYDGVRLSDIGYTICYFDDDDYRTVTNGSEITFNTVSTLHGAKYERASSEYDDCLTATFQICKDLCMDDTPEISIHEFRHLMRWLNRKQYHKFKFINDEWLGFYWEGSFNLSRIEADDKIVGVELELTTNRPYGLMEPREIWIDAAGEPFAVYSEDDNSLTFYRDVLPKVGNTYKGKTITNLYTGLKNTGSTSPEWAEVNSSVKLVEIDWSFESCKPLSCYYWFFGFINCTEIIGLEYLDTSQVTDMRDMFGMCYKVEAIDVSGFNTSKVVDFSYMFNSCRSVTKLDISGFDTHNATNMTSMFNDCRLLLWLDVSMFHTGFVTNMTSMFYNCQSLTTIYSNDKNFVVDNVKYSTLMFAECASLVGGKGTKYDSSKVESSMAHTDLASDPGYFTYKAIEGSVISTLAASYPFAIYSDDDDSLTFYYDSLPASGDDDEYTYNGKSITDVYTSFISESYTNATIPWASHRSTCKSVVFDDTFYSARPTSCDYWFSQFNALAEIDLSGLNTSSVTSFTYMFYACGSLEEIDVSGMDTVSGTNFAYMFSVCRSLTTIYSDDSMFNIDTDNAHSVGMFVSSTLLVGGNGTEYDSSETDASMAHIDTDKNPGYFTSATERKIYDGTEYVLRDFSDEEGFIYPLMEITIVQSGTLTIYNEIEGRATTIRNCIKGEVITMDSPVITSSRKTHKLQNDFNWNFFRVANKMHNRDNKITITLPCTIKLIYSPVAKVGL